MFIGQVNSFSLYRSNIYNVSRVNKSSSVVFKGGDENKDLFDFEKRYKAHLDMRPAYKKFFNWGKKDAREAAINELMGYTFDMQRRQMDKDRYIEEKNQRLLEHQEKYNTLNENKKLLEEKIQLLTECNEKDEIILKYKQELEDLKSQKADAAKNLLLEQKRLDALKKEQQILLKRESISGWGKMAGYENYKQQLEDAFINKLAEEKAGYDVNIPNGILLYGPHGTGKTRMAKALAEQADCHFVSIDMAMEDDDVLMDLRDALRTSKKNYNSEDKKRTIILLDDFNSVAELTPEEINELKTGESDFSDTNVGRLIDMLNGCANKYKATIIMTTNHPKRLESKLLHPSLIQKQIFFGPPSPLDSAKIFKFHLNGFTDQDINYLDLGKKVASAIENDEAYSAQGIVDIVTWAKENYKHSDINEQKLMEAINVVKPDITKDYLEKFINDMEEYEKILLTISEKK